MMFLPFKAPAKALVPINFVTSSDVKSGFKEPLKPKSFQTHASAVSDEAPSLPPDVFDCFPDFDFDVLYFFSTDAMLNSLLPPFTSFKLLASS